MSIRYRPEIDGLRTVAVVSVLVYHAGMPADDANILPGGFLGVDVFFVISGFLITSIILEEFDRTGRISILRFYERRARRILPALLLVILASALAAWFILLPYAMIDFVWSALASIFFISNMYFYRISTEYGAESSLLEPLLHTWSLAVEEQFYIFFPLIYVLILRYAPRFAITIGVATIVLGLIGAQVVTLFRPDLSFFWLPSRIWELMVGGVLAHLSFRKPELWRGAWADRIAPVLGFALIVAPMPFLSLTAYHPGLATIPAVLGTALIVWFASPANPVIRLLSSRPFVAIGLVSYALYLWHYPVFAFGRITTPDPTLIDKGLWIALTATLTLASYRLVEQPCRRASVVSIRRLGVGLGAATAVTCVLAGVVIASDGLRQRFPALIALYGKNEFDNRMLVAPTWEPLHARAAAADMQASTEGGDSDFETNALWFNMTVDGPKVLIVGDSHSKDMYNALWLNRDMRPGAQFARIALHGAMPPDEIDRLLAAPNYAAANTVILSQRYRPANIEKYAALARRIAADGKTSILALRTAEFRQSQNQWPFDLHIRRNGGLDAEKLSNEAFDLLHPRIAEINAELSSALADSEVIVFDKIPHICNHDARRCDLVSDDGYKTMYDYGHYTIAGARFYGRRFLESGLLAVNRSEPDSKRRQ